MEMMQKQIEQLQRLYKTNVISSTGESEEFISLPPMPVFTQSSQTDTVEPTTPSKGNVNPKSNGNSTGVKRQRSQSSSKKQSTGEKKDKKPKELTYQEKKQLSEDIRNLSSENIARVVEIIQENNGRLGGNDEELEIDIDILETPALRALQKFIKEINNP